MSLEKLYALLDSFEHGEKNGEILIQEFPDEDLPYIAQCIKALPGDEQILIQERLVNLIEVIERHKNRMQSELARIQEDMLAGRKVTKVNVAYLQTSMLENDKTSYH